MTTRRLIASLTASAAVLAVAGVLAVRSFPLEAQGRATTDNGQPIQIVKGSEHLLHGELPDYPLRAIEHNVGGDVVVDLTVDERGEVSDARVLSGPDELRRAALEAVLGWHYSPAAISSTMTQATLRFRIPPRGFEKAKLEGNVVLISENRVGLAEHRIMEIEKALQSEQTSPAERDELKLKYAELRKELPETKEKLDVELKEVHPEEAPHFERVDGGVPGGVAGGVPGGIPHEFARNAYWKIVQAAEVRLDKPTRLAEIRTERVSQEVAKELVAQAGATVGDLLTNDSLKRIQEVVKAADEHFRVEFEKSERGLVMVLLAR